MAIDPAWARVRIFATNPDVVLERRVGSVPTDAPPSIRGPEDSDFVWKVVCATPCNEPLQVAGEYRVAGRGVVVSDPFAIHGPHTHLLVDAGSASLRRAGAWLTVVGFVAAAAGGIFLAVQEARGTSSGLGAGGDASVAALVVGGAMGAAGLGMVGGSTTSVRDENRRDLARTAPPPTLHATFVF